jgi:hypothetical protein
MLRHPAIVVMCCMLLLLLLLLVVVEVEVLPLCRTNDQALHFEFSYKLIL